MSGYTLSEYIELPKSVYDTQVKHDDKYYKKSFLFKYKPLLNIKFLKKDRKKYLSYVNQVHEMLKGVDFNKNLLFLYRENISREIFLDGFLHFNKLKSYVLCDYIQIHDLYWTTDNSEDIEMNNDTTVNRMNDFSQDILCIFIDKDMYSPKTAEILNSLISSRNNRRNREGNPLYTWVFFKGYYNNMRDDKWFLPLIRYFETNKGDTFDVINLNSKGILPIFKENQMILQKTRIANTVNNDKVINSTETFGDIY